MQWSLLARQDTAIGFCLRLFSEPHEPVSLPKRHRPPPRQGRAHALLTNTQLRATHETIAIIDMTESYPLLRGELFLESGRSKAAAS